MPDYLITVIQFPEPKDGWLYQYTLMMCNTVDVKAHTTLELNCMLITIINN